MDPTKLIDWLKLKPRHWLPMTIATAFVLFAPTTVMTRIGLEDAIQEYRPWIGLAFVISLSGLVAPLITHGAHQAIDWVGRRRDIRFRQEMLHELSPGEKLILRRFIDLNTKTMTLDASSGVHAELEAMGIISRVTEISHGGTRFDYNIQPWARRYLKQHPELLES